MKRLKVVLRVDGDNKIGLGHLYRTINLAKELRKKKFQVIFLTRSNMAKKIIPKFFKIVMLNNNSKNSQKNIIQNLHADIVIIDKLYEDSFIIKILNKNSKHLIGIDYTGKNKHLIKNGINMLYPKSGIKDKNSYLGLKYAILNNSFKKIKSTPISKDVKKLLVLQGGADTPCFTPEIIDSLNSIEENVKITVVLGSSFKCWKKLKSSVQNSKKPLKILHGVKSMAPLMAKHDLVISGGGMTLLELTSLGIPSIIICGAKFENETAESLSKKGFGINIGYSKKLSKRKITKAVRELMYNYNLRKNMNKIGKTLVDGNGTERIVNIISKVV